MIQAQSADGVIHEFPDGTNSAIIDRVMKQYAESKSPPLTPPVTHPNIPFVETGERWWEHQKQNIGEATTKMRGAVERPSWTSPLRAGLGAYEYATSPIDSALQTLVGDPVARITGSRVAGDIASTAAELVPAGPGILRAGIKGAQAIGRLSSVPVRALGKEAKNTAEALRAESVNKAATIASDEEAAAAKYQKQLNAVEQAQKAATAGSEDGLAFVGAVRSPAFAAIQQRVLANLRSRVNAAEQDYLHAGFSVQDATQLVAQKEAKILDSEDAVHSLEKQLLARPRATADEFGTQLRQVTKTIDDKYRNMRATQSGYKEAIENAQGYLRVDTKPIQDLIDTQLGGIRNPTLERTLTHVKDLLKTGDKDGLSIRSADSLRGYLDSVIRSKQVGDLKIDKETAYFINQVKKQLVKTATDSWQPYREALGRWRTLSRPLDVVERNGALKKTLDIDPLSTDHNLTEAQVVGDVVKAARNGNPVFSRLIEESPSLRDSARLYFTQDLFGKDVVPSPAALRTWLQTNERPLRQLGLYDEFKDMKTARETALHAVESAKDERVMTGGQLRDAEAAERMAKQRVTEARSLREKENARIEARELAEQKAKETTAIGKEKRLGQAQTKLAKSAEQSAKIADDYRKFETQISMARPREMTTITRQFVEKLRRDNIIDDKIYGEALGKIQEAENKYSDTDELRKWIRRFGYGLGIAVGVPVAGRHLLGLY